MKTRRLVGIVLAVVFLAGAPPKVRPDDAQAVLSQPPLVNSIGMELKLIPPGTFQMGSNNGDANEKPVHEVRLTKPFYLGVYEVTNAQWKAVMGDVPSHWKDDNRPVEQVNRDNVVKFCEKLSAMPTEKAAGREYRLPTEAEWEYACRAGTKTRFSFGDDEAALGDHAWFDKNAGGQTHPVGQKKANPWGLHDMHGNVWEWCSDRYGNYSADAATDPQGPSGGSGRVIRGGCWRRTAGYCRAASRYGDDQFRRGHNLGFRLALSPSGSREPEAGK